LQVAFYKAMRERDVYVNAPDDYLFEGGANKVRYYMHTACGERLFISTFPGEMIGF
jgi:hypothetical protein